MPTEDDLLINSIIFNQCNHPDHTTETTAEHGYENIELICTVCGVKKWDYEYKELLNEGVSIPPDYMKKFVPPHGVDIVTTRKIVRHLEESGWKSSISARNGKYKVNFSKGEESMSGEPVPTEHEAIRSAAVLLAKYFQAKKS